MHSNARIVALSAAFVLALAGCTGGTELDPEPTGPAPPPPPIATTHEPDGAPLLLASQDPVELALATSERYFASAHVVIMAPAGDELAIARAASIAIAAGTPLLLTAGPSGAPEVNSELVRLSTHSVLTVGAVQAGEFDATGLDIVPDPGDPEELGEILGVQITGVDPGGTEPPEQGPDPADPDATGADESPEGAKDDGADGQAQQGAGSSGQDEADPGAPDDGDAADGTGRGQGGPEDDGDAGTGDDDDAAPDDGDAGAEDDAGTGDDAPQDSPADSPDGTPDDPDDTPDDTDGEDPAPPTDDYVRALTALQPGEVLDIELDTEPTVEPAGEISPTEPTERIDSHLVLADGAPEQAAAVGIARAAGAEVALTEQISTDPDIIERVSTADSVLGLGTSFGDDSEFTWRTRTAATGVQLPGGGHEVFDHNRYIALYGHPATSLLGVLGEQGTEATIERAREFAEPYVDLTDDQVIPALEIIVTVATASAGPDGTYSNVWDPSTFLPLIEAAQEAGQYVVLDFQPGRSHFLDQVQMFEELLAYPHVGIALDPEWRLRPDQVHLRQIGHVEAAEVNEVIDYVADFVAEHHLPQKMLILHQFQTQMIRDRQDLDTTRPEVALLIHADGQGPVPTKFDTWRALHRNAPESVAWGWKNFIDEDDPLMTPEETYEVEPLPEFVSYQ